MFSVGDKVRLSDYGIDEYEDHESNPHDENGTICELFEDEDYEDGYCIRVHWENGYQNSYRVVDLELVSSSLTPKLVKGGFKRFAAAKL